MATYEKIDEDKVETTTKITETKEDLEQKLIRLNKDLVHLNQNMTQKEVLREDMQTQLTDIQAKLDLLM